MPTVRFAKPLTVTLVSAALLTLPLSGAALADAAKPQPTVTITTQDPAQPANVDLAWGKDTERRGALKVSVEPGRVRAGGTYEVTIVAKGVSSGRATVTSPEGKTYRVALHDGRDTLTLTAPAKAKPGQKTVTVKVGNKVATASFTVVDAKKPRDDRHHDGR
ncbi:quinohemoprotein amine dehydrogenase alpha subunit-like protein [Nonomuraea polychroma]|uniref:Quinohemoprotein amine dehydrogenase alpha subunit-like protein n=1 Tax=Nonomuraea polychroma TaxID=46176 RepID=A0A438MJC3_9ACTN|nr:quinohemoprotein amine dehydrogenase alpha subunit-like protein [Nonomuraea polychroma]